MEHTRIGSETHADDGGVSSRIKLRTGGTSSAEGDRRTGLLTDVRDIAAEAADRARKDIKLRVGELGRAVDERTGLFALARERPLVVLGAAFSIGFVIATVTGKPHSHWLIERLRRQLRTVLVGGAAAIFTHELRSLADAEEGIGEMLGGWLADDDDSLDD